MWDFSTISSGDSIDWEDPDADTIKKRILNKTESGSILLFHNDLSNTEEALPSILTELKQKGFEFVTVENLIYHDNYIIDSSGKQIYQPAASAAQFVTYSSNPALDSAFEKIRKNLSLEQIYQLSTAQKVELIDTIKSFLSDAELYAFSIASYEELYEAYLSLVYAAENFGAGGASVVTTKTESYIPETMPAETSETTTVPQIQPPTETYPPETYYIESGEKETVPQMK